MSTRPAQSSATAGGHRDLRLQAEVDLVDLHADVRAYPAGAAVRADHGAREHGLRLPGEDDGDRTPVGHGRAVLLDAGDGHARTHLGARLLRVLDQTRGRTRAG